MYIYNIDIMCDRNIDNSCGILAEEVTFDPASCTPPMTSTDVQDAICELNTAITSTDTRQEIYDNSADATIILDNTLSTNIEFRNAIGDFYSEILKVTNNANTIDHLSVGQNTFSALGATVSGTNNLSMGSLCSNQGIDNCILIGKGETAQDEIPNTVSNVIRIGESGIGKLMESSNCIGIGLSTTIDNASQFSTLIGDILTCSNSEGSNMMGLNLTLSNADYSQLYGSNLTSNADNNILIGNGIISNVDKSAVLKADTSVNFTIPSTSVPNCLYKPFNNGEYHLHNNTYDLNTTLNKGNYWEGTASVSLYQTDPTTDVFVKDMIMIENNVGISDNVAIRVDAIVGQITDPDATRSTYCKAVCLSKWLPTSSTRVILREAYVDLLTENPISTSSWDAQNGCKIYFIINGSNQVQIRAERGTATKDYHITMSIKMWKSNI